MLEVADIKALKVVVEDKVLEALKAELQDHKVLKEMEVEQDIKDITEVMDIKALKVVVEDKEVVEDKVQQALKVIKALKGVLVDKVPKDIEVLKEELMPDPKVSKEVQVVVPPQDFKVPKVLEDVKE